VFLQKLSSALSRSTREGRVCSWLCGPSFRWSFCPFFTACSLREACKALASPFASVLPCFPVLSLELCVDEILEIHYSCSRMWGWSVCGVQLALRLEISVAVLWEPCEVFFLSSFHASLVWNFLKFIWTCFKTWLCEALCAVKGVVIGSWGRHWSMRDWMMQPFRKEAVNYCLLVFCFT